MYSKSPLAKFSSTLEAGGHILERWRGSTTVAQSIEFRVGFVPSSATDSSVVLAKLLNLLLISIPSMVKQEKNVDIIELL